MPGQDMISLFQLWSLLGAGAGWEAPGVSPHPTYLTPEFLCQLPDGRRATTLHSALRRDPGKNAKIELTYRQD